MAGISKKIYKTKKGIKTTYVITYRDYEGKQHTYGNYETLKDAKKDLSKFEEVKANTSNNITFGEIINIFMEMVERKYAKNTIKAYRSYLNNYLKPLIPIKYTRLNPIILQELFDNLEREKPYTAHNVLIFCKGAVNYCVKKKKINKYNVFDDLDDIKRPSPDLNHLCLEKLLNVLEICRTQEKYKKYYRMIFLLVGSGLRIGELIALEKADVIENVIKVNKQFTAEEIKYKPKTDKSRRIVYMFNLLATEINKQLKENPECKLLFPNEKGGYINPSNFRNRIWKPLLKECGINYRVRLHDARGTYTDLILSNGLSGKFAQGQLGHEDYSTTYNIYARNSRDGVDNALDKLNELFSKKCEQNVSIKNNLEEKNIIQLDSFRAHKGIKKESCDS